MTTESEIVLRADDSEIGIAPALGGTLSYWRIDGADILRPRIEASSDPTDSACFVLAPFSNSISGAKLRFREETFELPINHPNEPLPIHGDAWLGVWCTCALAENIAEIRYDHDAQRGFPFKYCVKQRVHLSRDALVFSLLLQNTDHRAMPAGLGIHPYFLKPRDARLTAPHTALWQNGAPQLDRRFLEDELLPKDTIDDCFYGWKRIAWLTSGERDRRVRISASRLARCLVVYSPREADFVCIEPVTHVNDGINQLAGGSEVTGVRVLKSGDCMRLRVEFRLEARY